MALLDFTDGLPAIPEWLQRRHTLKLILWAGDMERDGITDVARLSEFDIYLCAGYCGKLTTNVEYISQFYPHSKAICLLDIHAPDQLSRFCTAFAGRFSVISADYNGNTPTFPIEAYSQTLAPSGRAYAICGINGARFPTEEFYNALELFAPVLPHELLSLRQWTPELIQLAKDNQLTPSSTWTSPDLKDAYYDGVRERQTRFMEQKAKRSPLFNSVIQYSADTLEEYWSKLPVHVLTVNLKTAWNWQREQTNGGAFSEPYRVRFAKYLKGRLRQYSDTAEYLANEYDSLENEIYGLQRCLSLVETFRDPLPGLEWHVGYFVDHRYPEPKRCFDIILSK